MPGLELGGGKAVIALRVADDGDRDGGAGLLGADQPALHRAFLRRRDLSGEGGGCGRRCRQDAGAGKREGESSRDQVLVHAHRSFPK